MYYFAYSSNLNHKQMAERCPGARPRFSAVLPNYKIAFSGWSRVWHGGVASVQPSSGDKVMGGIYEITEKDLARLDKYEGYPTEYTRLNVKVYRDTGEAVETITYIRPRQSEETKPSAAYLAVIRQGYHDWGLI